MYKVSCRAERINEATGILENKSEVYLVAADACSAAEMDPPRQRWAQQYAAPAVRS